MQRYSFSRRTFLQKGAILSLATRFIRSAGAAEKSDPAWQIGCFTRPWDSYDYRTGLDAVAEAGFRYIGLMTCKSKTNLVLSLESTLEEAERIGGEVERRGMQVPCVFAGGFPIHESLEVGIQGLKKLIGLCAAARGKALMVAGTESEGLFLTYYKAVQECCDYAAEKNVSIVLKPHGGTNATGSQCRRAIEIVGHTHFRLWYDPGNIFYYSDGNLDPVDDAETVDGLVAGLCVKDYLPPKDVFVTAGTGKVDFATVFARLRQGGFSKGPLLIETLTPGDLPHLLREAKKAGEFLRNLVRES